MKNKETSDYQLPNEQLDDTTTKTEQLSDSSLSLAQEGMVLRLADGSIQACNADAEGILGLTRKQIQEWTSLECSWRMIREDGSLFPRENHPALITQKTGKPCSNVVMGLYRPNNELIWLLLNSQPLFPANETTPDAVIITFTDITKRKKSSEIALEESQKQLRPIFDHTFEFMALLRTDGTVLQINQPSLDLMQMQGQDVIGQKLWQIKSWNSSPEIQQNLQTAIATAAAGEFVRYEVDIWGENNTIITIDLSVKFIKNDTNKVVLLIAFCQNITEKKQTEKQLEQSDRLIKRIADTTPDMLYLYDLVERRNVYVNRQVGEMLGYTPEQIQAMGNQLMTQLLHPEDLATLPAHLEQFNSLVNGEIIEREYRMRHANGEWRWLCSRDTVFERNTANLPTQVLGTAQDITHRKVVEAEIQRLNQNLERRVSELQTLLDVMPVGITIAEDPECTVIRVNQFFRLMLNLSPSANISQTAPDAKALPFKVLCEGREIPVSESPMQAAAFSGKKIANWEGQIVRDDNTIFEILGQTAPLFDEQGKVRGSVGVFLDITGRKEIEEALCQSEERYSSLAEALPEILFSTLPDGKCDYCNQRWYDYTGLTYQQTKDYGWGSAVHPDDIQEWAHVWLTSLQKGNPFEIECRLRKFDNSYRWFKGRGVPLRTSQGTIIKWLGICIDIEDQKQAEAEREQILVRSQQHANQLQGLTEAALVMNSALSIEEVLRVITEQARSIIGAHQSVTSLTIDHNWAQAISSISLSDKYAAWRDYQEIADGSGIYACVCHLNRSMRMTQAELEAHPMWRGFGQFASSHPPMRGWLAAPLQQRDGKNIGLIQLSDKYEGEFTPEDESIIVQLAQMASVAVENTQLYEAAHKAREQAEAANRIKDEFLAVLSHELRSPLNPILGWSKLLQTRKFTQEKTAEALATIERNARLQAQLIEDLLDVSRILQGKLSLNVSCVNLVSIVSAALETVRLAAQAKGIQIETQLEANITEVAGDSGRLQQIVWNLVSNAVKFTPPGGQIIVRLSTQKNPETNQNSALIQVLDTGKGICLEFLPYVFDYFRQADSATTRTFGGLGLGLAIVRNLVELHGGTVEAESLGEGQGATFTVRLPLIMVEPQTNLDSEPFDETQNLRGIKILVVDDDADSRDFISFIMEDYGAEVTATASAFEALLTLAKLKPDIILSDIGMPEMDGYMLLRQVRNLPAEQGGQVPAIALTAYAGEYDQQQAISAGFQMHIPKPVDAAELTTAVAKFVGRVKNN